MSVFLQIVVVLLSAAGGMVSYAHMDGDSARFWKGMVMAAPFYFGAYAILYAAS